MAQLSINNSLPDPLCLLYSINDRHRYTYISIIQLHSMGTNNNVYVTNKDGQKQQNRNVNSETI